LNILENSNGIKQKGIRIPKQNIEKHSGAFQESEKISLEFMNLIS
tara:strand:- start:249 stop:383 length:135 start_codon:yes stop_codon:yes gene_type:complete